VQALRALENRIRIFVSLPIAALDRVSLARQVETIGRLRPDAADEEASWSEVDPIDETTGALFLVGIGGSVFAFMPPARAAVVDAVGMWATRQRRPSAAACPQHSRPADPRPRPARLPSASDCPALGGAVGHCKS